MRYYSGVMYPDSEPGIPESLWRLFISLLLAVGAIGGLFFIFWGRESIWAVIGGSLLSVGCGLGLVSRWKKELEALDALFGHQARSAGMGFAYWIKRRLDRMNSYLARIASAVSVAAGVAVLWKPAFWLLKKIILTSVPGVSEIVIYLLEGLSHPAFGVLVGLFIGYGYYKSRLHGSHIRLD